MEISKWKLPRGENFTARTAWKSVFVVHILLQFVKNFLRQLYKNYIWLEREFYGEENATIPRSIGILVLALETSECDWVVFFFFPYKSLYLSYLGDLDFNFDYTFLKYKDRQQKDAIFRSIAIIVRSWGRFGKNFHSPCFRPWKPLRR